MPWPMLLFGAIKAGTQIYSGIKQKEAAEANADLLIEQAEFEKQSAFDQARRLTVQGQAFLGRQKYAFASSGVKVDEGSPLAVMKASQKGLQQDISRTRQIGENVLTLGINRAKQVKKQGKDAFTTSLLGAGTTFLTSTVDSGIFKKKSFLQDIWEPTKSQIFKDKRLLGGY